VGGLRVRWLTPARLATAFVVVFSAGALAAVIDNQTDRPSEVVVGGQAAPAPVLSEVPPPSIPEEPTVATIPPTTVTTAAQVVPTSTARKTTTTTAKLTTTTTATTGPSSLGPRPSGSVVFGFQSARSAWSGTANGITLQVQIDPAVPRAGDPVRFKVVADDPTRECCLNSLLFGDGGNAQDPTSRCTDDTPGTAPSEFTHVYNQPGRWEFSFQAMSGRCGDHNTYGALYGVVEVIAGTSRGQGPALPTIQASEARAPGETVNPGALKVWANARDEDGYILQFTIDFGDGHATEIRLGDPAGCRTTPSGWPAPSTAAIQEPYPANQYDAPGDYTVTITVTSTGCDRTDEQRAVATIPFHW
jgi:hypothetical protein